MRSTECSFLTMSGCRRRKRALCRIRGPLPIDPPCKSLEQRREHASRSFVREAELPIESLVSRCHQELWRSEGARVHVAEELSKMQLGPRGADLARRRPHQRHGLPG